MDPSPRNPLPTPADRDTEFPAGSTPPTASASKLLKPELIQRNRGSVDYRRFGSQTTRTGSRGARARPRKRNCTIPTDRMRAQRRSPGANSRFRSITTRRGVRPAGVVDLQIALCDYAYCQAEAGSWEAAKCGTNAKPIGPNHHPASRAASETPYITPELSFSFSLFRHRKMHF